MTGKASIHRVLNSRGMTLVELMVAVAIIAIVAGVASPSIFKSLRRERAAGVAREVANELRRARNQSMARGEVILVQVVPAGAAPTIGADNTALGRGGVVTFATNTAPFEAGTTLCDAPDAGVDPDELCPEGSRCLGGACWSEPARSCRQVDIGEPQSIREVARFNIDLSDSANMALRGHNGATNVLTLCFSPDGRVLDTLGRVPSFSGAATCSGDNTVLWLAKEDATASEVTAAAACAAGYDDRDPLNLYRISVPYNGAIAMDQ